MKKKTNFFFFGFGQTAKYFVKELINSKKKFIFFTTNTKKTCYFYYNKKKFKSYKFNDDIFDFEIIEKIKASDFILISIPPQKKKRYSFKKISKGFKKF